MEVSSGDLIRLGRQFLLFSGERSSFGFAHYDAQGKEINSHSLGENTIVVGRDAPDITLDNGDGTLSRRHLSLAVKDGKIFIKDLMSMNGSYLKVRTALKLSDGDLFRVGASTFKMVLKQELSSDVIHTKSRPPIKALPKSTPPAVAPPKEKSAPPSAKVTGTVVVFKNEGRSVPFTPGQSVCDIAEKNGVKISAECHAGICGSDPVRILSGKENLNPLGDDEKGTLEDICGVKPGECRLACMLKPTGAVEVEILNP
jgi:ferredoxin